ncbi:uncharacterized protein LOC112088975 isoform X2 [Eutrema salsugineum]|uniref:uncharacterized protein LOC112088975 isoform X2 n=1 Tax=Eutrema salsugineum TaxID=72664 RepID=UPI000CECF417|nr:uncharacterized protein LOC112088975 isoform X2 [Eutrema salsugineum]
MVLLGCILGKRGQFSSVPTQAFKTIWKQDIPPKIKHFWWRAFHHSLPVAMQLKQKHILQDSTCQVCGEKTESVEHLIFNCRVSKEIWDLAPVIKPSSFQLNHQNINEIYMSFVEANHHEKDHILFFHMLGWRIWKQRNDVIFNNTRWPIPQIIHKTMVDFKLWKDAMMANDQQIHQAEHASGIGWILYNSGGQRLLCGSSAIEPTQSSIESEAEALRMAVINLRRLGYKGVTICGDLQGLYVPLQQTQSLLSSHEGHHLPWATFLYDIQKLATPCDFTFRKVNRASNRDADDLAKKARITLQNHVIKWLL